MPGQIKCTVLFHVDLHYLTRRVARDFMPYINVAGSFSRCFLGLVRH